MGQASLSAGPSSSLPLPAGIRVAFNHDAQNRYRSPITRRWRQGQDLELFILEAIRGPRGRFWWRSRSFPCPEWPRPWWSATRPASTVRVILEDTYSTPWSEQHPADLLPRERHRRDQLEALGQGDAVAILHRAGIPLIDDTADGSAGSGLMHHKFMVVDRRVVVTGSANFSPSGIHGDVDDPRSRGNVNHLLRFDSEALAMVFAEEFDRLWGDGPGGEPDSRFGIAKQSGPAQRVMVAGTPVEVLFAPHRRSDPNHGLRWLETRLAGVQPQPRSEPVRVLRAAAGRCHGRAASAGVSIRLLADPGFRQSLLQRGAGSAGGEPAGSSLPHRSRQPALGAPPGGGGHPPAGRRRQTAPQIRGARPPSGDHRKFQLEPIGSPSE